MATPDHPVNRGSSDPITQGTILGLYDPDRSQHVRYRGENREWSEFIQAFQTHLAVKKVDGGTGVYILTNTITSPTLAGQIKKAQAAWPNAKFLQYDPVNIATPPMRRRRRPLALRSIRNTGSRART